MSRMAAVHGLSGLWRDETDVPERVRSFRFVSTRLLLIEQWLLLIPIMITAHLCGNSWIGIAAIGGVFHAFTTLARMADPIGLTTRSLIATGMLIDVLLLIYALTGVGSWQMDGGHMWIFAVWSHCLALLCWRSLVISGTLGVLHHFLMIYLMPLWVFPDGANVWRVVLHGGVVVMQISVLCVFVVFIIRMLRNAEQLETALAATLERVEDVSRSKSQFLAHMSHELRTPLNAIIGFSEITKQQMFGPISERYLDYADHINASGSHLLALINDVLDLSRVESGKYELQEKSVDVRAVVDASLAMVGFRAGEAGLGLSTEIAPSLPRLRADERAVKQVLLNLLSNAVKYTPTRGAIVVRAAAGPAGLEITVSDTGCGIPAAMMARLFEPFQRADSMVTRKVEGSGLGLAISRHYMELHGGTLVLRNEAGGGTVAIAIFPAARMIAAGEEHAAAAASDEFAVPAPLMAKA